MTDAPGLLQVVSATLFALAVVHTFIAGKFARLEKRFPRHAGVFHLLGEVEVVFGVWAIVLVIAMALLAGVNPALAYVQSREFTEPMFVFVVMVMAASNPVLQTLTRATHAIARWMPMREEVAVAWLGLAAVPLLGSLVTEPAAMTIAALMLAPRIFCASMPERLKYLALGVLFVNVSIGGTLTSFAAPPVLMVAATWGWDSAFMLSTFGWKAALAVVLNASLAVAVMRRHLRPSEAKVDQSGPQAPHPVLAAVHLGLLAAVVLLVHHPVAFIGVFVVFLGIVQAYGRYQSPLIIREALLVSFFLAGLVVLGGMQQWWLEPVLTGMPARALFFGSAALTAITDNAALTYLGSLIAGITDEAKYALVAGAVAGGGLTVIANAPNPGGVALLKRGFAGGSIGPGGLLAGALLPTLVALAAFGLL